MKQFDKFRFYSAACFNLMFTVLATVTLLGIIFITRPKVAMHNIPPSWWIPVALVMLPGLIASQLFTYRAVFREREIPTPLQVAATYRVPPAPARQLTSLFWFGNYLISFVILVSLYKPDANRNIDLGALALVAVISFFLSTAANIYLMLFTRTISDNELLHQVVWRGRHVFTLAIALVGFVYYFVLG